MRMGGRIAWDVTFTSGAGLFMIVAALQMAVLLAYPAVVQPGVSNDALYLDIDAVRSKPTTGYAPA